MTRIILSAWDFEANVCVDIARWNVFSYTAAQDIVDRIDKLVGVDARPDPQNAAFCFKLDIYNSEEALGEGHPLPTQIAKRIAPAQVVHWLNTRPDEDASRILPPPPVLEGVPL